MNEAATPRVRRPSWRDPRLGVGVLLVAGSVALGSWTVSRADDTVTVYTTATVLSPGDQVDVEDLVATQVQVPALAETYLTPGEEPATGLVVLRTVGEGEMVPLAALGSAQSVQVRTVTVDRKSTRLNSSHVASSYAVFCLKKKNHLTSHDAAGTSLPDLAPSSSRLGVAGLPAPQQTAAADGAKRGTANGRDVGTLCAHEVG